MRAQLPRHFLCAAGHIYVRVWPRPPGESHSYTQLLHRWLRPGPGIEGHPDNEANDKLRLTVCACEALQRELPPGVGVAVSAAWVEPSWHGQTTHLPFSGHKLKAAGSALALPWWVLNRGPRPRPQMG